MLSIIPNYSSNVNFTSKLRLNPNNKQQELWKEVAKEFEKRTKNTDYEFYLEHDGKTIRIDANGPTKMGKAYSHSIELNKVATAHMMRFDKSDIAEKLIHLQKIYKNADKTRESGYKFLETLKKNDKYETLHQDSDKYKTHYFEIYGAIYKKYCADILAGLKRDAILYDSEVLY